jgi:hypothetical protein
MNKINLIQTEWLELLYPLRLRLYAVQGTPYLYPAANKNPFPVYEFCSIIFTETENKIE